MPDQAPVLGVGIVLQAEGKVLLIRRSRPPAQAMWALPGGKVQFGETLCQAAEREMREETGLHVKATDVVYVFELIEEGFHFVIVDLRAHLVGGSLAAADDASAARWFSADELSGDTVEPNTRRCLAKVLDMP